MGLSARILGEKSLWTTFIQSIIAPMISVRDFVRELVFLKVNFCPDIL